LALDRFRGGREGTLWYYHALVTAFNEIEITPQTGELRRLVEEIDQLAR
jgi:GTP pyrophosphokinase